MSPSGFTATKPIAIIGAGMAGLILALGLQMQNVRCEVYELRPKSHALGGAIMLSPNALRAMDQMGIYARLRDRGFSFKRVNFMQDEQNDVLANGGADGGEKKLPAMGHTFGDKTMFGYDALRMYRQVLIGELREMCEEKGIGIHYEKRFERLAETENGATVEFADGSAVEAAMVVGTDGIHSKVREYVAAGCRPVYTGQMAVASAAKRKDLKLPRPDYHLPVSVFGKSGVFLVVPQDVDGSECMVGTQTVYPEQDKAEYQALSSSPERMESLLREKRETWSEFIKSAIDNATPDAFYVWPFYDVPRFATWTSEAGKVMVIGDSAHALPPTLGQGANQAVEDAYALSLVLSDRRLTADKSKLSEALRSMQRYRDGRIDQLVDMTKRMNNNRLPLEKKEDLPASAFFRPDPTNPGEEMRWLYDVDVRRDIKGISDGIAE